jgi:organic radical activating enzyme
VIKTLSICHECYARIPAEILFRDGQAWIRKTCDVHGESEALVDPDASIVINHYNTGTMGVNKAILVPVTADCNMTCSWCFTHDVPTPARSAEYYNNKLIDLKIKGFAMLLSGGEPTVRPDFFQLVSELTANSWPVVTMSNMLRFADPLFMQECARVGLVQNGLLHADFSMQHPKNYSGEIAAQKFAALANLERNGLKANCIQFSVSSVDEMEWIRKFYDDTKHLYNHMRIRSLYSFWKDDSEKIYLSQLYTGFIKYFGDLTPMLTTYPESSNIYSLYMRTEHCGISLSSSPTVHNVDLLSARRPTYAMALDGKYYSFPVAQIISAGLEKGWYNGFRIQETPNV